MQSHVVALLDGGEVVASFCEDGSCLAASPRCAMASGCCVLAGRHRDGHRWVLPASCVLQRGLDDRARVVQADCDGPVGWHIPSKQERSFALDDQCIRSSTIAQTVVFV